MKAVRLEIPEDLHAGAKKAAVDARMTLRDWIENAIREQVSREGSRGCATR